MVTKLKDTKRLAMGERLADLKAFQSLIISNDQKLIDACPDEDVRKRLQNMLEDDQKNLGIIETVMVQYGIQAEPSAATKIFIPQFEEMMSSDEFTYYQKLIYHELMKHGQAMSGIVIHKAAQKVGADIEVAIDPLNTVNLEGHAHQEQLKGMLEMDVVGGHIPKEEFTMFSAIDNNCSDEEKEPMPTEFKAAKSKFQQEMAAYLQ